MPTRDRTARRRRRSRRGWTATAAALQAFHGFDDGLPSIYRWLAQWPTLFNRLWADLGPVLESETYSTACARTDELVDEVVDDVLPGLYCWAATVDAAGEGDWG